MALVLTQAQVRALLPMAECIELVSTALTRLAEERADNPLRWAMPLPNGSVLGMMPGRTENPATVGLKCITVSPSNHGSELDAHQGVVILFDPERGHPLAVFEASSFTSIRTAAASGVATRILSRAGAGDLAILGSGVQARAHLEAMLCVRAIRRIRVYSPTSAHLQSFVRDGAQGIDVPIVAAASARDAVVGADLVCVTTSARQPVLQGAWLEPGAHVNAVGACLPTARELDAEAVARSRLFVDRRESALAESGDYLLARDEGAIEEDHIRGEIGDVILGRIEGRRDEEEITLFESLGIAVEDLMTAHHVLARAREAGVGVDVDLSGHRDG